MAQSGTGSTGSTASRLNVTFGLGMGALLFWVLGVFLAGDNDENSWIWLVMAALSLASVITGFRAKRVGRLDKMAMAGLVVGTLLLILFLLYLTGILQ